jgi:hypothetical protein
MCDAGQVGKPRRRAWDGKQISLAGLGDRARREINRRTTMTRNEHEEVESYAIAAMIGLISANDDRPELIVTKAFDIAEAFQQEKLKRIGEKPPYDC